MSAVLVRRHYPVLASLAGLGAALALTPRTWKASADVVLYARYAAETFAGHLPYRDFFIEYPPGVLAAILPPGLAGTRTADYAVAFAIAMLFIIGLTLLVAYAAALRLGLSRPRALAALAPLTLSPLLLGPIPTGRYDLLPALAVAVALLCMLMSRDAAAAAVLGLGTVTKLYPALLLPLVLIVAGRRSGFPGVRSATVAFGGSVVAVMAPFAVLAPRGLVDSLRFQVDRPPSFESFVASMADLAHHWFGFGASLIPTHSSFGLGGTRGAVLGWAQALLLLGVLVWILLQTLRVADHGRNGWLCAATALAALVTFGQALSPQYLLWLLPVVPLVTGRYGTVALGTLVGACLLTRLFWATPDNENINATQPTLLLAARNLCLLATLVALMIELAHAAAQPGRQRAS
jgi:Glycosyltransferase family 87